MAVTDGTPSNIGPGWDRASEKSHEMPTQCGTATDALLYNRTWVRANKLIHVARTGRVARSEHGGAHGSSDDNDDQRAHGFLHISPKGLVSRGRQKVLQGLS
jgi:hypothetical protein